MPIPRARANTAEETGANARTRPADATAKWRADLAHHCTAASGWIASVLRVLIAD
jgi:hypothetical protein